MSVEQPSVSRVGGRIVVDGAPVCAVCGSIWVAWDKGVTETVLTRRQPHAQTVLRTYARLRCAQGHLLEVEG